MAQREVEVWLYSFFNLGARWGWVVNATLRPLYPRERPGTHFIGRWVGPTAGINGWAKFLSQPGFTPQTIQAVASSFTIYAAHPYSKYTSFIGLSVPHEYIV
jgi:hypothetical protein